MDVTSMGRHNDAIVLCVWMRLHILTESTVTATRRHLCGARLVEERINGGSG